MFKDILLPGFLLASVPVLIAFDLAVFAGFTLTLSLVIFYGSPLLKQKVAAEPTTDTESITRIELNRAVNAVYSELHILKTLTEINRSQLSNFNLAHGVKRLDVRAFKDE